MMISMTRLQQLHASGELQRRIEALSRHDTDCRLCPKDCGLDRTAQPGPCGVDATLRIGTITPHQGEEPPIAGTRGAGAVFFTGCHMHCVFCQNWQLSHRHLGAGMSHAEFADAIMELQARGCHNLDLVSPTHYLPAVVSALALAVERGFRLPIVYNTNGYERVEILRLLDGIVDIYLPDAKYGAGNAGLRYSAAGDYFRANELALAEMFRQVGHLELDDDGIATRGLIVRHLVLPNGIAGTREVLEMVKRVAGPETHVSLMGQYQPLHRAAKREAVNRRVSDDEYAEAFEILMELGFENGWCQENAGDDDPFTPDFADKFQPFRQRGVTPVMSAVG